jgi:hypothetical protein
MGTEMSWFSGLFKKSDRLNGEPAKSSRAQALNPGKILFSVATLAGDLAALEPIDRPPKQSDVVLGEDDWSQLEFLPNASLATAQRHLSELKAFEQANRKATGWRNVYVRKMQRTPVLIAADPVRHVQEVLHTNVDGPPFITASGTISGRIQRGFTFNLGGNTHLYGYLIGTTMPVLAASVGPKADNMKLATAFMRLHQSDKVMLVDWRAQLLLVGVNANGNIETWRP